MSDDESDVPAAGAAAAMRTRGAPTPSSESEEAFDDASEDEASSDSDNLLRGYDARAELAETHAMLDDMHKNGSQEQAELDAMELDQEGWIAVQNEDEDEDGEAVARRENEDGEVAAEDEDGEEDGEEDIEYGADSEHSDDGEEEREEEPEEANNSHKRKRATAPTSSCPSKGDALGYDRAGKRGQAPAAYHGGGAMPCIVGSNRAVAVNVNATRPTPTDYQEPRCGLVPYRTDGVVARTIGDRECVLEALSFALGSNRITRAFLGLPLTGDLNMKEVADRMRSSGTPYRLVKSPAVPWSGLLAKSDGMYIGRALLKDGEIHYMGYDSWRHLIFVGGSAAPPAIDEAEQFLFYDGQRPQDEVSVGRCWLVEEHELQDPVTFQAYMVKTLNVQGGIDNLYRIDMIVKHVRQTAYNTPDDYD